MTFLVVLNGYKKSFLEELMRKSEISTSHWEKHVLSEAIERKREQASNRDTSTGVSIFKGKEGSSTLSLTENELDFPMVAGKIFIDCMIESVIDLIPDIKSQYYEGFYNKFQMCLLTKRRNAFLPDIREYAVKTLLDPLDPNSKYFNCLKPEQSVSLQMKILPKIMLGISNIENFNSKSMDLMFLNLIPHFLKMEAELKEFKKNMKLERKKKRKKRKFKRGESSEESDSNEKQEGEKKSEDLSRQYNFDSIALCKIIHYFYAKYERRFEFYKDKDPEIYTMLNFINKFLTFYDAKYLKSLSIIRDVFRNPHKTYFRFYEGWEVTRDLLIKINGYQRTI